MSEFLEATFDKFIFRVKEEYLYHPDELWVDIQESYATVGLTDFLQKTKGDIIFLETIGLGTIIKQGEEIGKIETIKAVETLISPVSGKVVEINPEMEENPYIINEDPYKAGWIYRIEPANLESDKAVLLNAAEYFELMKQKVSREAKKLYG
ncbi:MAG: glycine cleavage system protein GcvH [Smithella sp.]